MTKPLALPGNIAHLVDALTDNKTLLDLLRDTNTLVGGGSVLAAHWRNHRRSTDLDLMMPPDAFDTHQDALKQLITGIPADEYVQGTGGAEQTKVFSIKGVLNKQGDIEIVRDGLGRLIRRNNTASNEPTVSKLKLAAEPKEHIIAKKFSRILERHERDYYDIVWAAYRDPDTLVSAIGRHVHPRLLSTSASQAQGAPQELFHDSEKPVLSPRAPDWKDVLAEVMIRIDRHMRTADETPMALPTLDIAKRGVATRRRQEHGR